MIKSILLIALVMTVATASQLSILSGLKRLISGSTMVKGEHIHSDIKAKERRLLPQLPPHKDTCFIIEFVSERSDQCKKMESIVRDVENVLNIKIRRIDVSQKPSFLQLYECVGGNECGNLPFYYNRRTAQAICGATYYENLMLLAMGELPLFRADPTQITQNMITKRGKVREMGFFDYVKEKWVKGKDKRLAKSGTYLNKR